MPLTPQEIADYNARIVRESDERDRVMRDRWNRHRVTITRKDGRLWRICSCGCSDSVPEGVYDAALNRMCPIEAQEAKEGR